MYNIASMYWLTAAQKQQILDADKLVTIPEVSDEDKAYIKSINADADLFQPIGSHGWRTSDIDVLQKTNDVGLQNVIMARNRAIHVDSIDTSDMSDDDIANTAIPRNLSIGDIAQLSDSIDAYKRSLDVQVPAEPVASVEPAVD